LFLSVKFNILEKIENSKKTLKKFQMAAKFLEVVELCRWMAKEAHIKPYKDFLYFRECKRW